MTQNRRSYIRRGVHTGVPHQADGTQERGPAPPPPLRKFNLRKGDFVKIYETAVFDGQWRLCEVVAIYPYIVACRDARSGVSMSFRILDYLHNDGVVKIQTERST